MKNRTIIGIICLVLALLVTFVVAPFVNRITEGTEEIIIVRANIKQGAQITEDMVELVAYPKENIPKGTLMDTSLRIFHHLL